jgi:uncharacterized membrane protein YdbT with pleckstrin-like domain
MRPPTKHIVLLLPLAITACGDGTQAKLDRCKNDIRAELTALVEKTKQDTAESLKALEPGTPADPQVRQANGAGPKFSNDMIKAMPDMFAAMAGPMVEAQLKALEPTPAGLAKCEEMLAQARQK